MFRLAPETKDDWWEVENLYDLSFAPGREALSSYRLREGVDPISALCLVARDDLGVLSGVIRYWPIVIGEDKAETLLLGPIAVHPTCQGEGLGNLLMHQSLGAARALGWKRVLLVGDAPYYGRFGFQKNTNLDYPQPVNPERVLTLELSDGAFDGVSGVVAKAS
ncbi:N-acetyltransferase [Amylibacter sp. SFDW26]|uniref:GNAT family N-acetyltransferase n=1 Tax=Amylibacter sp. SFDW26 TaxID=2652722 RepID=UPI001261AB27|nr:N-acetyltransferase [Amylibacter sp. SFDW26]KAB7610365.1 N-acetyltransferase [Amylibacter sp. SFDW26]